ncbi:MAG: phosphoribosylformylglycinamidine synthase subunit PurQ [Salibacteraceae bacterium]
MKFGVITFPGSNCDRDMIHVLGSVMNQEVVNLWHKERNLQGCDVIIVPGGFSYGDYLRSGAIARFSPIMDEVLKFAAKGGRVFGVCNGFQILCEARLLPGTLLHNINQKFICDNVYVRVESNDSFVTALTQPGSVLKIPIAHGEGRFFAPEETLDEMKQNDQILFRYADHNGQLDGANPNGSVENIAGICNKQRNVIGMMPHPERAAEEILGNTQGRILFESMVGALVS